MSKNNIKNVFNQPKKSENVFDFFDDLESPIDEAITGMLGGLIEAGNRQMEVAMELTKLIAEKNTDANIDEEKIFSIFKRASKIVAENAPLKGLLEKTG
ncbi:MAG TPA: hypothetical protein VGU44_01435 [Gammaproteobacteria bacterium]|nr:hypothetical protein [Gammaproteobacteria bacterium]